jgi:uncharacterized protein involved in exopolysaccharide biosynthesis
MDTSVIERLLDTYFRRPLLFLLPLILSLSFGVYAAVTAPAVYRSGGILSAASGTLLSNLSGVGLESQFGSTPASEVSQRINEQLLSDDFVTKVAEQAGLVSALESNEISLGWIRAHVGAKPEGANLLTVSSVTEDPAVSQRLAAGTIETFIQSVIEEDLGQSAVAVEFYEELAGRYDPQVAEAEQNLAEYLTEHPEPAFGERPPGEQARIVELSSAVDRVEEQQSAALARADEARLATEQARVDIAQRLRVVDPPALPTFPLKGLRDTVLTIATFAVLGTALSAALVIVAAFLDKTIRTQSELRSRFGFDVIADVPAVKLERAPQP